MRQVLVAGIDAGSSAIKLSLYEGTQMENMSCPAGWNPKEQAANLLADALAKRHSGTPAYIVGTG